MCASRQPPTLPRLAVVGLNPAPARRLAALCAGEAVLVFLDGGRARTAFPPRVEFVIFSRFVPHRAFLAAHGLPRVFCPGGLSSILKAIRAYAARRPPR